MMIFYDIIKVMVTIVGGGISGLSLAYFLLKKEPFLEIKLLEATDRVGGKILSEKKNGFLCESGANGFLNNRQLTIDFIKELSLEILKSNNIARKRFIYYNGKLHLLPTSFEQFLFSGFISLWGKIRLLYEVFIPPRKDNVDENISSFAKRRLGIEIYEKLIDPMVSGIFAGDSERLSIKSCFPRIYEIEQKYGSLFKGLFKIRREKSKKIGPLPSGILVSFYDGMEIVTKRLKNILEKKIYTSKKVEGIELRNNYYTLKTSDGENIDSEVVVLATPAYETSYILKEFDIKLSKILSEIPYPSVSVVCMGFKKDNFLCNVNGFGFLVPSSEGRNILGTLWDSSIFPNRAPEGYILLRSMVGGAKNPEIALKNDNELVEIVLKELKEIMGINVFPEFVSIYRHEKAIPQYNIGHTKRLAELKNILKNYKGLYITGNAYKGIGFNDCLQSSFEVSKKIFNMVYN